MRAAIERYLSLTCGDTELPRDGRLQELAWTLDDLLLGLRTLPSGEPSDDDRDAERIDYNVAYAEISRRFPELGIYPSTDPLDIEDDRVLVGDAVDDAADIALDLAEALWHWRHVGEEDAAWHIHFGFRTHWGQHLLDLRRHLHALIVRAETPVP
jgi:hypothetical protein